MIALYGDSNTNGTRNALVSLGYSSYLSYAVAGTDSAFGRQLVQGQVQDPAWPIPEMAFICYGGVDSLHHCIGDLTQFPDVCLCNIQVMRNELMNRGVLVVACEGLGARQAGSNNPPLSQCLDQGYRQIWDSLRHLEPTFSFRLPEKRPGLWAADGIHASPDGYRWIARRLVKRVEELS